MIRLVIEQLMFYSEKDEASLFDWLNSITEILEVHGETLSIVINCNREFKDESLRELIAAFHRYGIEMSQLAPFRTDLNSSWFADKNMYWYNSVFVDCAKRNDSVNRTDEPGS